MEFSVGDMVMISPDSEYYGLSESSNPADVEGTVIEARDVRHRVLHNYVVQWPSGYENGYRERDLIPAAPAIPVTVEKQQEVAKGILDKLRVYDPHAIVAGGAALDWKQGNVANDVDIFVSLPAWMNERREIARLLERVTGITGWNCLGEYDGTGLNVTEKRIDGVKVQVIVTNGDPHKQLEHFPYSLTMISWNGESYYVHPECTNEAGIVVKRNERGSGAYCDKTEARIEAMGYKLARSSDEVADLLLEAVGGTALFDLPE